MLGGVYASTRYGTGGDGAIEEEIEADSAIELPVIVPAQGFSDTVSAAQLEHLPIQLDDLPIRPGLSVAVLG